MTADFADRLASMLAAEAAAAHGDHERMAAMLEAIARGLGFAVALAGRGNAALTDTLMSGAEAHAHAEAVERGPFVRVMATMGRKP